MKTAHDYFGHMGDRRTRYVVARKFVWPGMARDISLWCKSCIVCQKQQKDRAPMCPMPILTEPFEAVAVDLVGPFPRAKSGHRYLLTLICLASRYPEALPLKCITAEAVAEGLIELFSRHGVPRSIKGNNSSADFLKCCVRSLRLVRSIPPHTTHNQMVSCKGSTAPWFQC